MPHINDLTQNVVWEGNNGEKWIVENGITSAKSIDVKLVPLKIEQELIKEKL
jgi:hypothetical protein